MLRKETTRLQLSRGSEKEGREDMWQNVNNEWILVEGLGDSLCSPFSVSLYIVKRKSCGAREKILLLFSLNCLSEVEIILNETLSHQIFCFLSPYSTHF
jgi:hypothetical protein